MKHWGSGLRRCCTRHRSASILTASATRSTEPGVTVRRVRGNGAIKWKGNLIYVSEALKGEPIGLVQQDEHVWTIQFGSLLIGALDDTARRVDRTPVKVLPMSPV